MLLSIEGGAERGLPIAVHIRNKVDPIALKPSTQLQKPISLNEYLKVKINDPIDDEYVFYGKLIKVENENIYIEVEDQEIVIDFNNIKKSRIEFNKFKQKVKS